MPSDHPDGAADSPGDPNPSALPLGPDSPVPGDPTPVDPVTPHGTAPGDPAGGGGTPMPSDAPGDAAAIGPTPIQAPRDEAEHGPAGHDDAHPVVATATEHAGDAPWALVHPGPGSAATDEDGPGATLQTALALEGPALTADALAPDPTPGAEVPDAALRIAEALIFASAAPVSAARLAPLLPAGTDPRAVLGALAARTAGRGVALTQVAGGWAFRTAPDLAAALTTVVEVPRRLPRAAMEALAIIAWHQPVTRPEIEEIRGASLSGSTLEILLENGLVAPRGKKEAPGRPTLWGTTARFLDQFALDSLRDLPRREELLPEPGLPLPMPEAVPAPDADGEAPDRGATIPGRDAA